MKTNQARFLLVTFGISFSLALIGMALSIFGWASGSPWFLYSGIMMTMSSLLILIYANRSLNRIMSKNYENLTSKIDSRISEAKAAMDRKYKKTGLPASNQNTKPGNSQEQ